MYNTTSFRMQKINRTAFQRNQMNKLFESNDDVQFYKACGNHIVVEISFLFLYVLGRPLNSKDMIFYK